MAAQSDGYPVNLSQAQRRVIAEILPHLGPRLKLDESAQRTIRFTLDELKVIRELAAVSMASARTGMIRNSLRHVADFAKRAVEDAAGVGTIPKLERMYQFKITLRNSQPPIWRRIQIRDCFVDAKSGFARAMMPLPERPEGVVWVTALAVVPDEQGREKLIGHYTRRKGLQGEFEQGIAMFDDEKAVFTSVKELPLKESWRRPSGHPIRFEEQGKKWLLFGSPTPNIRVPATLKDVFDPDQYEAFTCLKAGATEDRTEPNLGPDGAPSWRWQKVLPPLGSKAEQELVKAGKIKPRDARFFPADVTRPEDRVVLHSGSVRWNEYRKRWILLAGQIGGKPSLLGEVWYAEAEHPTGPFASAVRVVTHG